MSLVGNINGPEVLLRGTPKDVQRAVRLAAAAGLQMIAPECAVAPATPVDNLKALADAVQTTYWSKLRGD